MVSSAFMHIPLVMKYIYLEADPKSILDVGCGLGKWGFLCREYLDIEKKQRLTPKEWQIRIDAIEVFEKFITPVHRYIYNNIYIGKAEELIQGLENYDLILIMDMLEHMETVEVGKEFLRVCFKKASRIIVSTPKGFWPQRISFFGNNLEKHRCGWQIKDLEELGFRCVESPVMSRGKMEIVGFWEKKENEK